MADLETTQLTELSTVADGDKLPIVDIDDTTGSADGTTKFITKANLVGSSGDVSGPASATDNAVARFDGTGGKTLQNSGVTIDDSDNLSGVAGITIDSGGSIGAVSGGRITLSNVDTTGHIVIDSLQTLNSSSGTDKYLVINPTVNGSGTQGYNAIELDVTETATGSGSKNLIDLKVGTVSQFTVSNVGTVTTGTWGADLAADTVDAITEIASGLKSGSDGTLITGTAGTNGDLAQWDANGDLVDGPTPPTGTIVGTSDTQTLTNKDLTSQNNTFHKEKSITIEDPSDSEDISMFFTNKAITVTEMRAVLVGSSTPSVTWTIRHGTDRSATGAEVVTSGTTTTSVSTGSDVTSFNDATIVADSHVWLETTAQSGTVDELHITIFYTED